ncbi:proteinaceous RNase P 2 [Mangifera indica]|uniref:proteinaceous RNase P 2 n=1 Tax=Mangifera indica TaxID=29780 RepID=UPI001CFBA5CF|nr:proteinaceous RNase P 2 [Mangifera indica]
METTTGHSRPNKKRKTGQNPETNFLVDLQSCSKSKDLQTAISLYESALSQNLRLSLQHFNGILYLCSNFVTDQSCKDSAINYGLRVFDHMLSSNINPNEASVTAVTRLAAGKNDGGYAFDLIKRMNTEFNIVPRLRTYDPALFCFCENLEADKAYEVEEHMGLMGVSLEEPEIAALLKVSSETGRGDRVYGYLQKLRNMGGCVSEETGRVIEAWFDGEKGSEVKGVSCDVGMLKEAILKKGGGWHGMGWIGEGKWVVKKGSVDESGQCCCGEQLCCVDIDDVETERFAQSIAGLALEREVKANFSEFQDWLEKHGDYEAIVDGANIALYQQNFADGGFNIPQLDAVVKELYDRSDKKWPLIILHNKRLRSLLENPFYRKLVEEWMDKGVLYLTPHGSNDDWYWLYAAVKLKCLLVTNDEMRDHNFELLGSSFFQKWKERHQVRYTFVRGNLKLEVPPQYSFVIQESEKGAWHVPISAKSNGPLQTWLCVTRPSVCKPYDRDLETLGTAANGHALCGNSEILKSYNSRDFTSHNEDRGGHDSLQNSCSNSTDSTHI